ncbi:MAG: glycosyltransferase family 39 protein [Chloroflexi bacterium]|nr:glycosyltransferase family 39 protein [Chloroflexota bacterium]
MSSAHRAVTIARVDSHCRTYRLMLGLVVVAYLLLGGLYAIHTPPWQVPDEPAHYNYIHGMLERRRLPVLEVGDYDQDLLGQLTSERFPPELPTHTLEYEDHQPPLYYMLAAPLFWLSGGNVLVLRLFSVGLGAGILILAYRTIRILFPARPYLAVSTAALIAFIPQHLAMMAGVNNDVLGELMVAAILCTLMDYIVHHRDRAWWVGILLGLALLTKTTAYPMIGVAVCAVLIRWYRDRLGWRWIARQAVWFLGPALMVSAPWFARNGLVYGWTDPFGLGRHTQVVEGQPRSSEWLANYGWLGLTQRLVRTTFRSFWGQFGWMGVVLPVWAYRMLGVTSALWGVGFIWWLPDFRRLTAPQKAGLAVLAVSALLTVLAFLWYNLTFVQHQGRYLFPALIPVGLVIALSIETWGKLLPVPARAPVTIALFVGLAAFDVYCLFRAIVPALAR